MADFDWLGPWYPADQPGIVEQLRAEMAPGHVLEGEPDIRLIARRDDNDEALFALSGGRVAEVHMTWRRTRESESRWPLTAVFPSLDDWVHASMIPLQRDLAGLRGA